MILNNSGLWISKTIRLNLDAKMISVLGVLRSEQKLFFLEVSEMQIFGLLDVK